ncbi:unnamed protein product, partial [marine sediment metagenome]
MPFDVVAFLETQTAENLSGVDAVADRYYDVHEDDLKVKEQAPFLAGLLQIGVTTPKYCEIRQPSLKVPPRFYKSCLTTVVDHRAGFTNLLNRPLPLYAKEKMNVYVQNASAEYSVVVVWLSNGKITQASIDAVNPTHKITGYADQTLTVNVWNDVPITWDQDLPRGTYAIVGMRVGTYVAACTAIVARLQLKGKAAGAWHPGVIVNEITADKTLDVNNLTGPDQVWPLMSEISFTEDLMPDLEMLSLTADEDHIVELDLVKT